MSERQIMNIHTSPDGELYVLAMHRSTRLTIRTIINRVMPFVVVRQFHPNPVVEWWSADVPVSPSRYASIVITGLQYDFQVSTSDFLTFIDEMKFGIEFAQFDRRIPAALIRRDLAESSKNRVWKQNGLFLKFSLPHENETAVLSCVDRAYVEEVAERLFAEQFPS